MPQGVNREMISQAVRFPDRESCGTAAPGCEGRNEAQARAHVPHMYGSLKVSGFDDSVFPPAWGMLGLR